MSDEALYAALSAFQAEVVTVARTSTNPFFKSAYAPLEAMMKAAQPVLTKHGLAVVQLPSAIDGHPALRTVITHESGQSIEATTPLMLAKDDPQSQGSAITYMRRYAYAAALGIVVDEDDDGNSATRAVQATDQPVRITDAQVRKIQAALTDRGLDRPARLAGIAKIVGHSVDSTKDLTAAEARKVIDTL